MKYYVFGDIHGQYERLKEVLDKIDYGRDGQLVFLGDYVSRGKKSREVLDEVRRLNKTQHAVVLQGNHDYMFAYCHDHKDPQEHFWRHNYLKPTLKSYYSERGFETISYHNHIDFVRSLPRTAETPTFHFSHSGDSSDWLWGRPSVDFDIDGKYNVHGHTPSPTPFIGQNRCNLDTGCAWREGTLTCAVFQEGSRVPLDLLTSTV